MVSRGGRSKGCSNCRRRKVKCDEARPVCLRCKKGGVTCDGPRSATWVDQTGKFPTQSLSKKAVTNTTPPVELPFAAFENDICLAYARTNLLRGGLVEVAYDKIDSQESSFAFSRDPALALLRKAMLSLSITFFGKQHHEDRITTRGYNHYGEVLTQLNAALTVPDQQTTNETILTVVTCMILEIFLPTEPSNFMKHQRGIEAIMSLRGPPIETAGETATIFRGLRIISIVGALVDVRPSIYAREEWKHAPIADTGEVGMLQAKLFTVLADCTQLMSDCDALLASKSRPDSYNSLLVRLDAAMADLNALYPLWERTNNNQLEQTQTLSRMAQELGIANHLSASAYMLFHTIHICILQMKESLNPASINTELRNGAALKIATCLELKEYEKREGGAESNTIGFVATKVAWQALGGFNTPEGRRLARVVRSAVNGVYRSPFNNSSVWRNASGVELQNSVSAQRTATATSEPRLYHLPRYETELIDIGYKFTSAPFRGDSFSRD